MKKIFKYTFVFVLALGLTSCDKLFDSLEGDLTLMTEDDMTSTQAGLERLLSDVYNTIPMDAFNTKDQHTTFASYSKANDYDIAVTGFWNYTKMRSINSSSRRSTWPWRRMPSIRKPATRCWVRPSLPAPTATSPWCVVTVAFRS